MRTLAAISMICASVAWTADATARVSPGDRAFFDAAAQAIVADIEANALAVEKAVDPGIRTFGTKMLKPQKHVYARLLALAEKKNAELPTMRQMNDALALERLSVSHGLEFDRLYDRDFGMRSHHETMDLLQHAADASADPDIRSFARHSMLTLERAADTRTLRPG